MDQVRHIESDRFGIRIVTGVFEMNVIFGEQRLLLRRADAERNENVLSGDGLCLIPGGGDPSLPVLNADYVKEITTEEDDKVIDLIIDGEVPVAAYSLRVRFPRTHPGLVISSLTIRLTRDIDAGERLFSGSHFDLSYNVLDPYFRPSMIYYFNGTPGALTYHTVDDRGAIADLNQFIFFGDPHILDATIFAYTDFTSLNRFYALTGASLLDTVRQPPGCLKSPANTYMAAPFAFGYDIPAVSESLKSGTELLVSNTLLFLQEGVAKIDNPADYARRFILAANHVYSHVEKPEPEFVDWPAIVERGLDSLAEYEKTPDARAVILHQTNLNSIARFARTFASGKARRMVQQAERLIEAFSPKLPYGDAWQYLFPIIMVGEYAKEFESGIARSKFLSLADDALLAGNRLEYIFPLRIGDDFTKEETIRYEYDCTGAYVYLMILYYEFTGDEKYLAEARNAASVLMKMGFEFPYEFTTASLAPIALLRLHTLTGESAFLEASYIPVAAIIRHSWFFNPGYREYQGRNIFLLTEGMPGVYANGWEEASLLHYLPLYLAEGNEVVMPEAIRLVSELLRNKCSSLTDCLAPLLPDRSIIYDEIPREWHMPVNPDWYIPVEGFGYLEWDKSGLHDRPGRVSQPPYCFGALPEAALLQFHPLSERVTLYCEAPVLIERTDDRVSADFRIQALARDRSSNARIYCDTDTRIELFERADGGEDRASLSFDEEAGCYLFSMQPAYFYRLVLE